MSSRRKPRDRKLPFEFPTATATISDEKLTEWAATLVRDYAATAERKMHTVTVEQIVEGENPIKMALDIGLSIHTPASLVAAKINHSLRTTLGNLTEQIAIQANRVAFGGLKATSNGLDCQFEIEGDDRDYVYLVAMKSSTGWGNSSETAKVGDYFKTAAKTIKTSQSKARPREVVPVVGCVYGLSSRSLRKEGYFQIAGQDFWHFISGDASFLSRLVKAISASAEKRDSLNQQSFPTEGELADLFSDVMWLADAAPLSNTGVAACDHEGGASASTA